MECIHLRADAIFSLLCRRQADVNQQQAQIIESYRKWKEAQVRADEAVRLCAKQAADHIKMLLDENHTLAEDYRCVYRDYQVLETEMQRVKRAVNYTPDPSMSYPPHSNGRRMDPEAGNDVS